MEEVKTVITTLDPTTWKRAVCIHPSEPATIWSVSVEDLLEDKNVTHYPFTENVECFENKNVDDEGHDIPVPMNRAIITKYGTLAQILWGDAYLVGKNENGEFCDISDEDAKKFVELFKYPHFFVGSGEGLKIFSRRDASTFVEEAFIHHKKENKRKKG